jgi:cytidylate kinase
MLVTIDGPAGAGKSTVARRLAERLGFAILDTGAMYRAVTLRALERGISPDDAESVTRLAEELDLDLSAGAVLVDGRDVTQEIRAPRISEHVSSVADHPGVRKRMVKLQREIASKGDFVCEGRDQGTVAFPDADVKIFLTASIANRSHRRWQELRESGFSVDVAEIESQQIERDRRDAVRPVGALRPADDAIVVDTDQMDIDQVVDKLESIVRQRASTRHE